MPAEDVPPTASSHVPSTPKAAMQSSGPEVDWLRVTGAAPSDSGPITSLGDAERPAHAHTRNLATPCGTGDRALPAVPGYELLKVLGRGGMGVVYLARQQSLDRLVALKMILAGGHASPEVIARFRAETALVAQLQHPNIVQIYEVGEHEGQPFCALEYIEGSRLDDCTRGQPQPARQSAELVAVLARTMQAAHDLGIIHRDLKPSNVLLRLVIAHGSGIARVAEGNRPARGSNLADYWPLATPKITDFGLAKRLSDAPGLTQSGDIIGTPNYMAPEQAAGRNSDVGTPTDIYALGAILYELLTGRPPFQGGNPVETMMYVQLVQPLAPRRLQPSLPRDLETICLKCLQKEPVRRYKTSRELAEDLDRFVEGRPIRARPAGMVRRFWQWSRRRPSAAAAAILAAALFVTALALTAIVLSYNAQLGDERDKAHAKAVEADKARQEMSDALDAMTSEAATGWLASQRQLLPEQERFLRQAVEHYRKFARGTADDEAGRVRAARGNFQLGQLLALLGRNTEAEAAFSQAAAINERLAANLPSDPRHRPNLAATFNQRGTIRDHLGQRDEAEKDFRRALEIYGESPGDWTDPIDWQARSGQVHHNLARLCWLQSRFGEAETGYRRALALMKEAVAARPDDRHYQLDLSNIHNNLGVVLRDLGRPREAETEIREALRLRRNLADAEPANPGYRFVVANSYTCLAGALADSGHGAEASAAYHSAMPLVERLANDFPSVPGYRFELAINHANLGNLLREHNQPTESLAEFRYALALWEKLIAESPTSAEYKARAASAHGNVGVLLNLMGKPAEAEAEFRQLLSTTERLLAESPATASYRMDQGQTYANLGVVLLEQGRLPDAEAATRRGLDILTQLLADFPNIAAYRAELAKIHQDLSALLSRLGRNDEAGGHLQQAIAIREKLFADFPTVPLYRQQFAGGCVNLGHALRDRGEAEASLTWFDKAVNLLEPPARKESSLVTEQLYLRNAHWGKAMALEKLGRNTEALSSWDQAVRWADGPSQNYVRLHRAILLANSGHHAEAYQEANALAELPGSTPPILYDLARTCARAAEAAKKDATLHERYAARAVQLLRQAIDKGYSDFEHLKADKDLDSLRQREDFRRLLQNR